MKNIIKKIIKIAADLFGLQVFVHKKSDSSDIISVEKNIWLPFLESKENENFNLYFEGLKKSNVESSDNFSKQLKFYSLFQLARNAAENNSQYDFVECGCWTGHSSYMISKILRQNNFNNKFHIFDSFEGGLSSFQSQDKHSTSTRTDAELEKLREQWSSSEDFVRDVLKEFDFVKLYKGWIPDRFKEVENRKFQFVHIDVDLYQPTLDALEFFYPRLVSGGVIVCDDYNLTMFPGAKQAWDEFFSGKKYFLNYETPFGGSFLIK